MIRPLDLGLDTPERLVLLQQAIESGDALDAFLLAAGMEQIAADHVQRDSWHLGAIARRVFGGQSAVSRAARRAALMLVLLIGDVRRLRPSVRRVEAWRRALESLVELLAADTVGGGRPTNERVGEGVTRVASSSTRLPERLRRQTARLPACFHAFDLDVADARLMSERFISAHPDRTRPILVIGVRTSGSYLAPLCAAVLRGAGYEDVAVMTCRPHRALPQNDRRRIRRLRERGLALVLDDPPVTGRAVDRVARALSGLGLPLESIVLLLPLFGTDASVPERLARYDSVLLPAELWSISAKLEPAAAAAAIQELLPADARTSNPVEVPLPEPPRARGHRRALVQLAVASRGTRRRSVVISIEGVGIGYLGRQALVTAEALAGLVPDVLGVRDGCLYRVWLPEAQRAWAPGSEPSESLLETAAAYFAARRSALAVHRDRSLDMFGEYPVWEAVSTMLSAAFGRLALSARVLIFDRLARHLLRVDRPSIADGAASLAHWFAVGPKKDHLVKVDFARDSFSNRGLRSYDAAWDLASAAVGISAESADRLRAAYEERIGEPVDDERLFLYELVRLRGLGPLEPAEALELERAQARSLQSYLARAHLRDVESPPRGELCAIDLDGVFETGVFGFQGTTANGALTLRALMSHGFRPVIVSGRSIGEVRDRCRAYGLPGGVAEYGSVVHVAVDAEPVDLMKPEERRLVEQVRAKLTSTAGVALDDAYRHIARAYVVRGDRRAPVPKAIADQVVADLGGSERVRTVVGYGQTDFVPTAIDKARGLAELEHRLGAGVALAVGDTISDLPMLRRADLAAAPANAERALRDAGITILRRPYQAGLVAAVERLIGHPAGGCDICRPPALSASASLVAHALALGERTGAARLAAGARLRMELRAATRAQAARAT